MARFVKSKTDAETRPACRDVFPLTMAVSTALPMITIITRSTTVS